MQHHTEQQHTATTHAQVTKRLLDECGRAQAELDLAGSVVAAEPYKGGLPALGTFLYTPKALDDGSLEEDGNSCEAIMTYLGIGAAPEAAKQAKKRVSINIAGIFTTKSNKRNESQETGKMRVVYAGACQPHNGGSLKNNRVRNNKYTVFNFVFLSIFNQFYNQYTNVYFIVIGIMQSFKTISVVDPVTTLGPFFLFFTVSCIKELYDDWKRRKADCAINSRLIQVGRGGALVPVRSKDIQCGDVVMLRDGDDVPADMVVLKTSSDDGHCFLQTVNLDGETNLKSRAAARTMQAMGTEELLRFSGAVQCPGPNADIYSFESRMWAQVEADIAAAGNVPRKGTIPLTGAQLLQQTTRIKNTDWVYGLVVYAGNQTKYGCNKTAPPVKRTSSDKFMDVLGRWIFLMQVCISLTFGLAGSAQGRQLYLEGTSTSAPRNSYVVATVNMLTYLLLNSTFIPISLKFSMVQKHTQAHTGTHRHTQTHTDTHRHTQAHTGTHRHTQAHTGTPRQTPQRCLEASIHSLL